MALAQHYGVPTRALDWTWSSLTAAYFATRGVAPTDSAEPCVWVFSYVARIIEKLWSYLDRGNRPLILFTAPGADNDNLRAQRGLFMVQQQQIVGPEEAFIANGYDELVPDSMRASRGMPVIFKVTALALEARAILSMLAGTGITAGALFPGLWGVAQEYEEEAQLEDAVMIKSDLAADIEREIAAMFRSGG